MKTIKAKSWNDLQNILFKDSWNKEYRKYISPYVFRGLNDKSHSPNTTLIRLGTGRPDLNHVESALIRNFRKYAFLSVPKPDCIWHLLSSAQHHGLPTRLLDWTYSPLVAMRFATADADKLNKDGAIWAVHFKETHKYLPEKLQNEVGQSGLWLFNVEILSKLFETLDEFDKSKKSPFILFFEPPSLDNRIINQFAVFSIISSVNIVPHKWLLNHTTTYRKIIIPARLKEEIRQKLDQFNITERVLFPGLDGLCTWLKRHYS